MSQFTTKLLFITCAYTLMISPGKTLQVNAMTMVYDFEINIDFGPLVNSSNSGFFSFDDSTLVDLGEQFIPVDTLRFSFLETDYTEQDGEAEVRFSNGDFTGLSFNIPEPIFSFIPGFSDINEASFAYDTTPTTLGGQGLGSITYTKRTTSIAEPSSAIGLCTVFALGTIIFSRRKSKSKDSGV